MARVEKLLIKRAVKVSVAQVFLAAASIIHSSLGTCKMVFVFSEKRKEKNYDISSS